MPEVELKGKDGGVIKYYDFEGVHMPLLPDVEKRMARMKTMTVSSQDVLICSYPKSGLHWIWEMTEMLVRNTSSPSTSSAGDHVIEYQTRKIRGHLGGSPTVFASHLHYNLLPTSFKENICKIIYISRDPRAVAVSFWHFMRSFSRDTCTMNFSEFLDCFLSGHVISNSWLEHVRSWNKVLHENQEHQFHVISYEDAKKDPLKTVQGLNRYLGTNRSHQFCSEIVTSTTLKSLKTAKESMDRNWRNIYNTETLPLYRKGTADSWKEEMTVTQSEDCLHKYYEMSKNLKIPIKSLL